ncbi:MAG: hypothetical protein ACKV22_11730 [Bryobacteraceae bacterium]
MRPLAILVVLASAGLAQHRGAGTSRHGFGNVVFPGTGGPPGRHAPVTVPGVYSSGSFAGRLGATVSGYPGYSGAPGYGNPRGRQQVVVVPWAYPAYYPQEQPNVVIVQQPAPPAQQQPQVIINQNFTPEVARPVVKEYDSDDGIRIYEVPSKARSSQQEESREPENSPFLIALKDQTIYAAFTFWLEGETLHYVTPRGAHNQVSLDRVDRAFTLKLNRDRELPVKLPAHE